MVLGRRQSFVFPRRVGMLLLTFGVTSGYAQNAVSTGSITGTVHDPSGQVVANANVIAVNEATGERVTSASNASGTFSFPALKIGLYDVTFSSTGFKSSEIRALDVGVGRTAEADATLVLGEVIAAHIDRRLLKDGVFDTFNAGIILRAGGPSAYAEIGPDTRFDMRRPA